VPPLLRKPTYSTLCNLILHQYAIALGRLLSWRLTTLNLCDDQLERLAHIGIVRRTGLRPATAQLLPQLPPFLGTDLALLRAQIALVAHNDDWHALRPEVIQDLIPDHLHHFETRKRCYAVDEHVAMDTDKVFRIEDGVFVLPGGIDDFGRILLLFVLYHFGKGILNGGIVAIDKHAVDKAYRE